MTHNFSVNCKLIHFLFLIKGPNKSPTFQTFKCALVKICKIPHVIFESTSHLFFLQILHQYSVPSKITPLYVLAQTCYTLVKSSSLKCKFLRFLNALMKTSQNRHVIFQTARKFFFKFYITLQCHER